MVDMETNSTASEHEEEWKLEPGLRIVGICGSLRKNSTTKSGLTVALLGAEKFGVDTHLIELSDYELPF